MDINKILMMKATKVRDSQKKALAGGEKMHNYDIDAKKFSRIKTDAMFPKEKKHEDDIEEAREHEKPVCNINKNVKSIKKGKKKGDKREKRG